MELLASRGGEVAACTICGKHAVGNDRWFLLTDDRTRERLNIWKWQPCIGTIVHAVCCPWHVRQLVVHWMTTGSLNYPFALRTGSVLSVRRDSAILPTQPLREALAEITVDRAGILVALRDNPLSLNTILDELMLALEKDTAERPENELDNDCFPALRPT